MTLYRQGVEGIEYEVAFMLRDRDYYVIRSAGSHGLIDLMAFWEATILAIQCKKTTMTKADQKDLIKWCNDHRVTAINPHGAGILNWPAPMFAYKDKLDGVTAIFLKNLWTEKILFAWPVKTIRALRKMKAEERRDAKSNR